MLHCPAFDGAQDVEVVAVLGFAEALGSIRSLFCGFVCCYRACYSERVTDYEYFSEDVSISYRLGWRGTVDLFQKLS
jgi:hypothetical protein